MSPPKKAKPLPLTPPLSGRLEHQYLVSNNSAAPYQPSQYDFMGLSQMPSQIPQTAFSSPESRPVQLDTYGREPYTYFDTVTYQGGLPPQYSYQPDVPLGQLSAPVYYPAPQHDLYSYSVQQQPQYPNLPYVDSSPSTPAAVNQSGGNTRTRKTTRVTAGSTRSMKANQKGGTNEETPRKAKKGAKQAPMDKSKIPKLSAPLSELTKDYDHIPVKDMKAHSTRSTEERLAEVDKKLRIPRPMNSFMLYRSAYTERCKIWCTQNNHQVVSTVCGASWALEPSHIKKLYADYAQVERENHAKAHPEYRFSPTKAATKGRKQKRTAPEDEEDEEEPSDLDDPDFELRPSAVKEGKKRAKTPRSDSAFPVGRAPFEEYSREGENGRHRSRFQYTNPGKVPPVPLGPHEHQGEYYQSMIVPNARGHHNVEDVLVRRTQAPSVQYAPAPPVVALPGANHYELLDGQSIESSSRPVMEAPLDPLLSQYNAHYNDSSADLVHDPNFEGDFDQAALYAVAQSTAPLVEDYPATADPYSPDLDNLEFQQNIAKDDEEFAEFESWMKKTNNR